MDVTRPALRLQPLLWSTSTLRPCAEPTERRQTGQTQGWVEYWLDYRLYRREAELAEHGLCEQFRTKPQLLIELLRSQDERLPVQTIAFDHQYLTPEVVQTITDELQRHWVSRASKSTRVCYALCFMT